MSKTKHRTPENLLTYPNGSGCKFKISKKIRNHVSSTSANGIAEKHDSGSVQELNGPRVRVLSNPNGDLTLKLRSANIGTLRWVYGFRVEEPEICDEYHVYSGERHVVVIFRTEHVFGINSEWQVCPFDTSNFPVTFDKVSFVYQDLPGLMAEVISSVLNLPNKGSRR